MKIFRCAFITLYERDNESDLDFAQARYYNFKHGRFTTVDPLMASADIVNPQTFNRYVYVGNNPVNITDPTGEIWGSKDGTVQWFDTEDAMKAAGFTAYTLLYAFRTGTNQMVALNANANVAVNVASAAAWLSQQVSWGATAQMLASGAAALAGVPVAAAALALGEILDPAGRYRTGQNLPEPVRDFAGTKQSYWEDFLTAMSKSKSNEASPPSANMQGETSPANPDPEDNKPQQSSVKDITTGRSIPNTQTNVAKSDFVKNLQANGYSTSTSKDGSVLILTKGNRRYVVRDKSNQGSPTADFYMNGRLVRKIRITP